jgi:hypothetical protein
LPSRHANAPRVPQGARRATPVLLKGIETDLLVQPIAPVGHSLLSESVPRVIPEHRPGLRRGCVQRLRIGLGHQVGPLS